MTTAAAATLGLRVSDVSGQKRVKASGVPRNATVRELVQGLIARLGLTHKDVNGHPLTFQARLAREGRHLHGHETVGDTLREDDEIVLTPNIQAG
jgi:hypothetical protein